MTHTSLPVDPDFDLEQEDVVRAVFYGLGSDGTVGANKSSTKIIGTETEQYVQGYFVYDSKKAGAVTVSHLRFGPRPIHSTYLIRNASFVACHQFQFLLRMDVLCTAKVGATFLINAPYDKDIVWSYLPGEVQRTVADRQLKLFVIDASRVAKEAGLGSRISTIMQTCFFSLAGILPRETAIARLKHAIEKDYGKKGKSVVASNFKAIDATLDRLQQVIVADRPVNGPERRTVVPDVAPDFVRRVTARMLEGKGDSLPVSAFPVDGAWPVGTSRWEKRTIAHSIPEWDSSICIQCNKCAFVCPHAAIRAKVFDAAYLSKAPNSFEAVDYRGREWSGSKYTIQVAPEDCAGCTLCYDVCPAKDKSNPQHRALEMRPLQSLLQRERENFDYFLQIPEADRTHVRRDIKGSQFLQPLFEFSGACAGCGETPYIKLLTQLFGDRLLIANATGCSSIYGGNLPTAPYTTNADGRGPAWSNSLFEDNAEFGLGFRLALDAQVCRAKQLLKAVSSEIGDELADELLSAPQTTETEIAAQRARVDLLRERLIKAGSTQAQQLLAVADSLVNKSVWLVGGDGWAYDIGYGGLDHILAQNRNINILVLDTEVYSNTGGQASKATPLAAAAKFAVAGKDTPKKDLGLEAMSYGRAYVARVAFGAKDSQTVQAFLEAESYPGPSLVIAYSHCIAHGYDLAHGLRQQSLAVRSGTWPLYRFDPRRGEAGSPPLHLDSRAPSISLREYMRNEARFRMAERIDPERFATLVEAAQTEATQRFALYEQLAGISIANIDSERE